MLRIALDRSTDSVADEVSVELVDVGSSVEVGAAVTVGPFETEVTGSAVVIAEVGMALVGRTALLGMIEVGRTSLVGRMALVSSALVVVLANCRRMTWALSRTGLSATDRPWRAVPTRRRAVSLMFAKAVPKGKRVKKFKETISE